MLIVRLPTAFTDPTLPELVADEVLEGANGGVYFLFDIARTDSWDGSTPTNGDVIGDLSDTGDGDWNVESGATVSIAGNGIDLTSNASDKTCCIQVPAAVSSALYGGGTSDQYWMACLYAKLPTVGDWWTSGTIGPLLKFAADNYTVGGEYFMINLKNDPAIQVRRATTVGNAEQLSATGSNLSVHYGLVTQILAYRNASGTFLRLKSSGGTTSVSLSPAAATTQDFSALRCQIGSGTGVAWMLYGAGAPRIYRGWIEDLEVSGRTATTVADADYTRTIARAVFS